MTTSQFHHPQTEDTKEEEWGAVSQATVSEGKEVQLEWTQNDGCPTRLGNTVEGAQRTVGNSFLLPGFSNRDLRVILH